MKEEDEGKCGNGHHSGGIAFLRSCEDLRFDLVHGVRVDMGATYREAD